MTGFASESMDTLPAEAANVAELVTGQEIVRVTRIESGVMTFKYVVETVHGERFITRFYPSERAGVIKYEPDILLRCKSHGMQVAEVVADSRTGPRATLEYLLYRMIPGVSMTSRIGSLSEHSLDQIGYTLKDQVRLLGDIQTLGFGDFVDGQTARLASWRSFVEEAVEVGLAQDSLPERLRRTTELLLGDIDKFSFDGSPSLAWGDLSPDHVILDANDEFAGLVDFEAVLSVEPLLTYGYFRARYDQTPFSPAFANIWPKANEPESGRAALYAVVRALRLWPHTGKPLLTGGSRDRIENILPGLNSAIGELLRLLGR